MIAMKDHVDIAERQLWNAFKKAYRESHPSEIGNTQYYERLRNLYKDQSHPTLHPWIRNCHHERQNQRVAEFETISRILTYVRTQIEMLEQA